MAIGDEYSVITRANLNGQTVINVYKYRNTGTDGTATQLATYFRDSMLENIKTICSNQLTFTEVSVINDDNETEFASLFFSKPGLRTGQCAPPFVAWGFQMYTNNIHRKPAAKRFGGVSEDDMNNGYPDDGFQDALDNVALMLSAIGVVSGAQFRPILLSRLCVKDLGGKCAQPPSYTYERNNITSAAFDYITSQNSRKLRTSP